MAGLPYDLIRKIFIELPVKSLARFRCINRTCRNLISNPRFVKTHLLRATETDNVGLFLATGVNSNMMSLKHSYEGEGDSLDKTLGLRYPQTTSCEPKVVGSCNGLICLISEWDNVYVSHVQVFILNPCTGESKIFYLRKKFFNDVYSDHHCYGFGYDMSTNDYILVKAEQRRDFNPKFFVHSLSDTSASSPRDILTLKDCDTEVRGSGVHLNGALHWVGLKRKTEYKWTLVLYDTWKKVVHEKPVPDSEFASHSRALVVLRGNLCMVCTGFDGTDMWAMKRCDTWSKLFSIERRLFDNVLVMPLYFTKNCEIVLKDGEHLVLYDPKEKAVRESNIHGLTKAAQSETYVESLVSLK